MEEDFLFKARKMLAGCKYMCPKNEKHSDVCRGICSNGIGLYSVGKEFAADKMNMPSYMAFFSSLLELGYNSSDIDSVEKKTNRKAVEKMIKILSKNNAVMIQLRDSKTIIEIPMARVSPKLRKSKEFWGDSLVY
jgi:hypothetical protein